MNRTRLHVIEGKSAPRLCDSCASGVVMRSAGAENDTVFCLFINCWVQIDIASCNRYAERDSGPGSAAQVCESAWVA
jgi:uncharacterized cysteine cluster protein YcgN (CxxCxxCC family)